MPKMAVRVSDLKLGMYVIELDRPWLGTPFDFQGFPLTSEEQIEQLKRYCVIVYIDPEREPWTPERRRAALGLRGSAVGAAAAIAVTAVLGWITSSLKASPADDQIEALFGSFGMSWRGYTTVVVIALIVSALTGIVSRLTVRRFLNSTG